nr:hypothetical protein [Tanacetum cinerariifolium]
MRIDLKYWNGWFSCYKWLYELKLTLLLLAYEVTAVRHTLQMFRLAIWCCSVNAVRSVPAALARSVPAALARSIPVALARSVPAALARSVPAVLLDRFEGIVLDRLN